MTLAELRFLEEQFFTKEEKQLSKHRKKQLIKEVKQIKSLSLSKVEPKTENQSLAFNSFFSGKNLLLHGVAGTGKTFISMYLSLYEIMYGRSCLKNVTLVRSAVPTRDIGFLPGTEKQKQEAYELPYKPMMANLFNRGDAYGILKTKGLIHFMTTSYIRGVTLDDTIVIVDECQNMTFHELDSIITRLGNNSRIIFCGDYKQSDFVGTRENTGIDPFMRILKRINSFDCIDFDYNDIVRSGLVRDYIIAKDGRYNDFRTRTCSLTS